MKVTTGIDIIEVERIKESIEEIGENFLNRIYSEEEIKYCNKSQVMRYQHFAGRFAAKEAVFKALSGYLDGRQDGLWRDIEIVNNESGRPQVNLERINIKKIKNLISIDISISHIKEYAIANAVATFE